MLTEKEIAIITLIRGINFTTKVLGIARMDALKIMINNDCFDFFSEIRKEIVKLAEEKGNKHVTSCFGIDKGKLKLLKKFKDPESKAYIEKRGRGHKRDRPEEQPCKDDGQSFVTSASFLKSVNKKKKVPVIVDKISALSKEFLVQEAEKLSNRFGICDRYDVDRVSLKDWTKSFQQTGVIRGSQRKYKAASDLLQAAYNELINEPEDPR